MTNSDNPAKVEYQPRSRQELYDMIRESSKDEVIRAEMIRYGFWEPLEVVPEADDAERDRLTQVRKELRELRRELDRAGDIEARLNDARRERMQRSRERQAETKARRIREREERAQRWAERKAREIVFIGRGYSGGLSETESDVARLEAQDLPVLHRADQLAEAMGITVGELRFLAYARKVSQVSHYVRFTIPKKSGGLREISAPMPRLKAAQYWILRHVVDRVAVHDAAHGFRTGRSIVSNAAPHLGSAIVVNLDLKDFFPTVHYPRVCGLFKKLGYSEHVATLMALICTEPPTTAVELDGRTYHVRRGERRLPQGGPTSPGLTNIICRHLDRRLQGSAQRLGFRYTRYADDLTFSAREREAPVGKLLWSVRQIVAEEGFMVHPDKTRVLRHNRRQEVTGVVVNDKLSVDRRTLRRFRATLHQVERDGPEGKHWGQSPDVLAALEGYASFVTMVDAERGRPLLQRVRRLRNPQR